LTENLPEMFQILAIFLPFGETKRAPPSSDLIEKFQEVWLMAISEAKLIERIRKGDQRAFAELVDRYKVMVFNMAYRILRHREEAEDIAQEAFVHVYHALKNFRGEAKFSTWLYRIVYNLCLSHLARRDGQKTVSWERLETEGFEGDLPPAQEDPEQILAAKDFNQRVRALVATLPPHYRAVLTLYHLQGFSYREIAEITGMPMGTVKTHLFRAKALLREKVLEVYTKEEFL